MEGVVVVYKEEFLRHWACCVHQQARDADAAAQRRHNGFERSATGRRGSGAADACQGVDWAGSRVCKDSGEPMAGGLPSQDRGFFGRPDFDFGV